MHVAPPTQTPLLRQIHGTEQIRAALHGISFPATKADVIASLRGATLRHGDVEAPLADLMRGTPGVGFADLSQAQRALETRWARVARALAAVDEAERARQ